MTGAEEFVEKSIEKEHFSTSIHEIHVDDFSSSERIDRPIEQKRVGCDLKSRSFEGQRKKGEKKLSDVDETKLKR